MITLALAVLLAATEPAKDAAVVHVLVLVGRPASTPSARPGIVPGTVLPSGDSGSESERDRRKLFDSLQESYRLAPLDLRREERVELALNETRTIVTGTLPKVEMTLLGRDPVDTYRVRLKQGEKTLAEPAVGVKVDGRAVVGTREGEDYVFVVLERRAQAQRVASLPPDMPECKNAVQAPRRRGSLSVVYPREALAAKVEGTVVMKVVIDAQGHVQDVRLVKKIEHPHGQECNNAAIDAVRSLQYDPALDAEGKPVACTLSVLVPFRASRPRDTSVQ